MEKDNQPAGVLLNYAQTHNIGKVVILLTDPTIFDNLSELNLREHMCNLFGEIHSAMFYNYPP